MLPFLQGVARRPPEGLSSRVDVGIRPYTRFFGGRFRRGRCPRSGAKRNKYPWGASPRTPRQRCHSEPVRRLAWESVPLFHVFMPPAASFLSAAKEKRKRNAAKNCVFGFSCAPSLAAYPVCFYHANAVPCKLSLNIALSLLLGALPLLLRNVEASASTAAEVSGSGADAEAILLTAR